jgi:hypothetical protein
VLANLKANIIPDDAGSTVYTATPRHTEIETTFSA